MLDAQSDIVLAKRRAKSPNYPEAKVHTKGEAWCSEVIKMAIVNAGFDLRKLVVEKSRDDHEDLRDKFAKGSYLIDGTLNKDWTAYKTVRINGDEGEVGPEHAPKDWRHAIAVKNGVILEWTKQDAAS